MREAALLTLGASVVACLVNLLHPEGIPFVAAKPYETVVPCPEPGGEVCALDAGDASLWRSGSFFVDARSAAEHQAWTFAEATHVPFDYLDPTPPARLRTLAQEIAASRASQVVVIGDGEQPDSGEQLGREIAGAGINNVCFVTGGAPALRALEQQRGAP